MQPPVLPVRLQSGADLKQELDRALHAQGWHAAFVVAGVGSLDRVAVRFAARPEPELLSGRFEILCLSGTLSPDGSHLHIGIADQAGQVLGGHVRPGCRVYTTAEILLVPLPQFEFRRIPDTSTGYAELQIAPREPLA